MGFNSGFKGLMDLASPAASQAAVYANGLSVFIYLLFIYSVSFKSVLAELHYGVLHCGETQVPSILDKISHSCNLLYNYLYLNIRACVM